MFGKTSDIASFDDISSALNFINELSASILKNKKLSKEDIDTVKNYGEHSESFYNVYLCYPRGYTEVIDKQVDLYLMVGKNYRSSILTLHIDLEFLNSNSAIKYYREQEKFNI